MVTNIVNSIFSFILLSLNFSLIIQKIKNQNKAVKKIGSIMSFSRAGRRKSQKPIYPRVNHKNSQKAHSLEPRRLSSQNNKKIQKKKFSNLSYNLDHSFSTDNITFESKLENEIDKNLARIQKVAR